MYMALVVLTTSTRALPMNMALVLGQREAVVYPCTWYKQTEQHKWLVYTRPRSGASALFLHNSLGHVLLKQGSCNNYNPPRAQWLVIITTHRATYQQTQASYGESALPLYMGSCVHMPHKRAQGIGPVRGQHS
jgi:hypothetical protein